MEGKVAMFYLWFAVVASMALTAITIILYLKKVS